MSKFGAIEAGWDGAEAILRDGGIVLVYPGGDHEAFRPWTQRNTIDFAGRKGFIRLALRTGVPIVPSVTHGVQDGIFVLSRGERLRPFMPHLRLMRLKVAPVVVGLPTGVSLGWPTIPLPTKATVQLGAPIDVAAEYGPDAADDDEALAKIYDRITVRACRARSTTFPPGGGCRSDPVPPRLNARVWNAPSRGKARARGFQPDASDVCPPSSHRRAPGQGNHMRLIRASLVAALVIAVTAPAIGRASAHADGYHPHTVLVAFEPGAAPAERAGGARRARRARREHLRLARHGRRPAARRARSRGRGRSVRARFPASRTRA